MGVFATDYAHVSDNAYDTSKSELKNGSVVQPNDRIHYYFYYSAGFGARLTYYDYDLTELEEICFDDTSKNYTNQSFTIKDYKSTALPGQGNAEAFKGWQVTSISVSSNSTTWVKLQAVMYKESTIDYMLDGGSNASTNPTGYYEEKDVTTKLVDAQKDNCRFAGWYTDPNFAESTKVTEITKDTRGNLTLYARFIPSYNITYKLDGGTNGAGNPASYEEGTGVSSFADATKKGYTFDGWYSDAAYTKKVTKISATETGDMTLYAKFTAITEIYNITYELDGGTNGAGNPASYEEGIGVPAFADATKKGYTFDGWYSDAAYTKKVTKISATETGNMTLYAKFTIEEKISSATTEEPDKELPATTTEESVKEGTQSPQTGDNARLMLVFALAAISGAGLVVIEKRRKG